MRKRGRPGGAAPILFLHQRPIGLFSAATKFFDFPLDSPRTRATLSPGGRDPQKGERVPHVCETWMAQWARFYGFFTWQALEGRFFSSPCESSSTVRAGWCFPNHHDRVGGGFACGHAGKGFAWDEFRDGLVWDELPPVDFAPSNFDRSRFESIEGQFDSFIDGAGWHGSGWNGRSRERVEGVRSGQSECCASCTASSKSHSYSYRTNRPRRRDGNRDRPAS